MNDKDISTFYYQESSHKGDDRTITVKYKVKDIGYEIENSFLKILYNRDSVKALIEHSLYDHLDFVGSLIKREMRKEQEK